MKLKSGKGPTCRIAACYTFEVTMKGDKSEEGCTSEKLYLLVIKHVCMLVPLKVGPLLVLEQSFWMEPS